MRYRDPDAGLGGSLIDSFLGLPGDTQWENTYQGEKGDWESCQVRRPSEAAHFRRK